MDKKSKILVWIFIVALIASVGITYYRYIIKRDYLIFAHVSCDPKVESCFYIQCEGSDCPSEIEYYKKISKKAFNIELCDSENSECQPLVCKDGEADCEIIGCSVDTVEQDENCSVPSLSSPIIK